MKVFVNPITYGLGGIESTAREAAEESRRERAYAERHWADFYSVAFNAAVEEISKIFSSTECLVRLRETAPELLKNGMLEYLRYLDRPTVSEDDFKVLAETGTISRAVLSDPIISGKGADFIVRNLNLDLFPWLSTGEKPTDMESRAAITAVSALIAEQRTKTAKRMDAGKKQESDVRSMLVASCGYKVVPHKDFDSPRDAPPPGVLFSGETKVAGTKADIVFGLPDGRFMAIECKVSNSQVNSFKRLNHEAVEKIKKWNEAFGANGVVGAVVLKGIFRPDDLLMAQNDGAYIFWSNKLDRLASYINHLK